MGTAAPATSADSVAVFADASTTVAVVDVAPAVTIADVPTPTQVTPVVESRPSKWSRLLLSRQSLLILRQYRRQLQQSRVLVEEFETAAASPALESISAASLTTEAAVVPASTDVAPILLVSAAVDTITLAVYPHRDMAAAL